MRILAAPLQGYTEAPWREAHAAVAGGVDEYFAPFIRVEKGAVRARDLRDTQPESNGGITLTPQAIFRDITELKLILDAVMAQGYRRLDLNLGCPFPPQCHKGRGAAMVGRADVMADVGRLINDTPQVEFSIKMRLGMEHGDEWRMLFDALADAPLRHLTVHPRIGRQQYAGAVDMEAFAEVTAVSPWPVVYNGDIISADDIQRIATAYPSLHGVMMGRGLLAAPWLAAEWRDGQEWSAERRRQCVLDIHARILDDYRHRLCGDNQVLMKIRPFWHYHADTLFPSRTIKRLLKATTLTSYLHHLADM